MILFLITGGTIDSCTEAGCPAESSIPEFVNDLDIDAKFLKVCMKDSRDLTQTDIDNLLEAIRSSGSDKIIITHGTYTMAETGIFLKKNIESNKTIVLTGSFKPLVKRGSDAPENIKFSIERVNELKPGVYMCMDNKVFDPEHTKKDIEGSRFVEV